MDPLTLVVTGVGGLCAIIAVVVVALAYIKQATVKAAMDTIDIQGKQINALTSENAALSIKYDDLVTKYDGLVTKYDNIISLVTQVAPFAQIVDLMQTLLTKREQDHLENAGHLSRLEGGIARVEGALLARPVRE